MKRNGKRCLSACTATVLAVGSAFATDGTWFVNGAASYSMTNRWTGGVMANGVGAAATFSPTGTVVFSVAVDTNVTLGSILYSPTCLASVSLASSGPRYLTIDAGAPDTRAQIWNQAQESQPPLPNGRSLRQIFYAPILLKSDLLFSASQITNLWDAGGPAFSVYSTVSEAVAGRSVTLSNAHSWMQATLFASNSFSGPVKVERGVLRVSSVTAQGGPGNQLGLGNAVYVTNGAATLDLNGYAFGPEKTLYLGGAGGFGVGALANSCQMPGYTSAWAGAVSLVSNATVGIGIYAPNWWDTFWMSFAGGPIAIDGAISEGSLGRVLTKTSPNTLYLRGRNTYSGGTTLSGGNTVATNAVNLGAGPLIFNGGVFKFGQAFDLSAVTLSNINSKAVILDTDGYDVALAGSISGYVANGLTKNGNGTLTLSGANSFQGVTTVNRGTLVLDYSSQLNSKVSSSGIAVGGGTLLISGGTGYTQTVNQLTVNMGASVVTNANPLGGTVMNLGATLSRSQGGTVSFRTAGAPINLEPGLNNGLYNGCATYGDAAWATWVYTNIPGYYNYKCIVPYTAYSAGWGVASNVDVTAANAGSIPSDAQANSMRFNASEPVTLTLSGVNSLMAGGILVTPAVGANTVTIQGGALTSKNANWNDLIIVQNNTNAPLVITSMITNNGTTAIALTKSGPGTLVLSNTASLFTGNVYVNGGALEIYGGSDLGDTNTEKTVYLSNGATLRVLGTCAIGSSAKSCNVWVSAAGAVIDVPEAGKEVLLLGKLQTAGGVVVKRGKGSLKMGKTTDSSLNGFAEFVAEEGTVDIGSLAMMAPFSSQSGVFTVRNGAVLKGAKFLQAGNNGRADFQYYWTLRPEGAGGRVDLNGANVTMGTGTLPLTDGVNPHDFLQGSGRLVVTNSSATATRLYFSTSVHHLFTGIFEVPGDYIGWDSHFALPNGELRLGSAAVISLGYYPITARALGALTGTGRFGGDGDPSTRPVCIGDDRAETFEFSGYLWSLYNGGYPGFKFVKTGSSSWRISGGTNDIRSDFTIRNGTVLVGANSPGNGAVGALGKAAVVLGDAATVPNNNVALLTDGPYTVGNALVISNANPGGTTTLGGNQTAGASSFTNALNLTRDVILTAANTDSPNGVTFSGKITGPGGITKTGVGTVYLTGAVSNAGPTAVLSGQLVVPGGTAVTNTLTVAAGTSGGGTLAVNGSLTLGPSAVLAVSAAGTLDRAQTYTLVTWTGSRTGAFASVSGLPENWHVGYRSSSVVIYYARPGTLLLML